MLNLPIGVLNIAMALVNRTARRSRPTQQTRHLLRDCYRHPCEQLFFILHGAIPRVVIRSATNAATPGFWASLGVVPRLVADGTAIDVRASLGVMVSGSTYTA